MKWFLAFVLAFAYTLVFAANQPLRPEEAFQVSLERVDAHNLEASFTIAPGHYLYRDRFRFESAKEITASLPAGIIKDEPVSGRVEIYPASVSIRLTSKQAITDDQSITLRFQGCEEGRLCYPMQTLALKPGQRSDAFALAMNRTLEPASPLQSSVSAAPAVQTTQQPAPIETGFFDHSLWVTLGLFLLAGLGLSFTACLYPLIPIVSSLVLGQQGNSRWRALGLTFCYVQGLALSYTLIGIAAAATGTMLTVALQQPFVIGLFALFFLLMALAMFGVFSFHLPSGWLSRVNAWSNRLPGGHFGPVFVMGALSALIIGPCNLPPLAAALAYLGHSGDLLLGGSALYAMALGMGLPLLALAWFGHTILPRLSGRQMQGFRYVFGLILAGFAIWVAQPLWRSASTEHASILTARTVQELDAAVSAARGRPVLIDFYADWCVACIEMEKKTFADAGVRQALQGWTLIRADITANTEASRRLLTQYALFAPPALVMLDRTGIPYSQPLIGFVEAAQLREEIRRFEARP